MPHTYVRDLLTQGYKGSNDDRSRHADTSIHVSDLYKLCPRAYALCLNKGISFRSYLHVGLQLGYVFDMGNKIQDIFTMRLMKTGMLFGTWECLHCGNKDARFQTKENVCLSCGSKATQYVDTTLVLKVGKLTVVGNVDTMLRKDGTSTVIFPNECKSIKPSGEGGFDTLKAPLRDHGYQVNGYMWMLRSPGVKMPHKPMNLKVQIAKDVATISYAVKGNAVDPFKVFSVAPDPEWVAGVEKKLDQMNTYVTKKKVPCKICKSEAAMMAKNCAARTLCFGAKW